MAIAAGTIQTVAKKGTYVFNVNPRQVLINNVGIDGYLGGGNLMVGDSASNLDRLLVTLATMPRAKFELDTGTFFEQWTPATVADVQALRAAFFALYGLGKPNWYGPPLTPPQRVPIALVCDGFDAGLFILIDPPPNQIEDVYLALDREGTNPVG